MSVALEIEVAGSFPEPSITVAQYRTLSVIIPVFNEKATVAEIIRRVKSVSIPLALEVIVVNDASTDGTDEVLADLEGDGVRVLHHAENRGKGAAVRTGLAAVTGDIVLIQDADLEYDPSDWPQLLDPVLTGKAKVVYGSRFTGDISNMTRLHWVGNQFLSFVTRVLYSATVSDMNTCYKLFDRRVLEGIHLQADRFDFDPEITGKILRGGHAIYEVPVSYAARGFAEGKKITWRDGGSVLAALVRCRFAAPDLVVTAPQQLSQP